MKRAAERSFITFLGSDDFLPGLLVLHQSLVQYNKRYTLSVLITGNISPGVISLLEQRSLGVIHIDEIANPGKAFNYSGRFDVTYTKLSIFGLARFKKLVYLDCDMIVCGNIEVLFDKPHFSAVAAGSLIFREWRGLNSGLLVIRPDAPLFKKMCSMISALASGDYSDQGFLHTFYPAWPSRRHLHLAQRYNVPALLLEGYCAHRLYDFTYCKANLVTKNISVIHYWGAVKPWQIDRKLLPGNTADKYEQAIHLWWDTFETL